MNPWKAMAHSKSSVNLAIFIIIGIAICDVVGPTHSLPLGFCPVALSCQFLCTRRRGGIPPALSTWDPAAIFSLRFCGIAEATAQAFILFKFPSGLAFCQHKIFGSTSQNHIQLTLYFVGVFVNAKFLREFCDSIYDYL